MGSEHLILCGGASGTRPKRWAMTKPLRLQINGSSNAVRFQIESLPKQLIMDMPLAALDLMEIAAYIYAADQACVRGGSKEFEYGTKWRRSFRFEIPVRDLPLWQSRAIIDHLTAALTFLTDDDYEFAFRKLKSPPPAEKYLFKPADGDATGFDEVMLFSGGLDSLAGAVQEILVSKQRVVLVSHVSTEKIGKPQRELVRDIERASDPGTPRPLHVQVSLNKDKSLGREFTQRTRSLVFAVFAGLVAHAVGRDRFRVYENGIVSFNLPPGFQILGARASRTTHPRSLQLLSRLLSEVLNRPMSIDNPFVWRTKGEILKTLRSGGHARLCARTISCAHTMSRTTQHTHCGRCSQCIDRRFVAIAAGLDQDADPDEMYAAGWTDPMQDDLERTMLERYVGTALQIREISDEHAFMQKFGEVARAMSGGPASAGTTLRNVFELHKRHANQVHAAMSRVIQNHASEIASRTVPSDSPLGVIGGNQLFGDRSPSEDSKGRRPSPGTQLRVCEDSLAVLHSGRACSFGNTLEFRLIRRLAKRPGNFFPYSTLLDDVWESRTVTKGAVQKIVSNVNRKLREAGIMDVRIEPPPGGGGYLLQTSAPRQRCG